MSVEDGEATLEEPSECVQGRSQWHIGLISGWEFGTGHTGMCLPEGNSYSSICLRTLALRRRTLEPRFSLDMDSFASNGYKRESVADLCL